MGPSLGNAIQGPLSSIFPLRVLAGSWWRWGFQLKGGSFHACCAWILRVLGSTGALCHLELKNFAEAVNWCDKGLQIDAKEKKLLEMRVKADKLKVGGIISSQLAFVN